MLTKELLQVDKRKPHIMPVYRDIGEYRTVAASVIDAFQEGRARAEIEETTDVLETHDTFKFVRGLVKLLERQSTFEQQSPIPPAELRQALYERGYVVGDAERDRVIAEVAEEYGIDESTVDDVFWADREEHEILVSVPAIDADELIRQYNLSLTQTLLFDAHELRFTVSGNYQEIFGMITYLGLMYTVDEDLTVHVTGPAALFKKTRKYGTTLAKLVPSIMKADDWSIEADVETEVSGEERVYQFELDDGDGAMFPDASADVSFDSEIERDFVQRLRAVVDDWEITREPTILRTDRGVMVPDFSFVWQGHELFLEIVGFWTPEYLEEKLAKIQSIETAEDTPLFIAVNESLNCTKKDFPDEDRVIFYDKQVPIEPIVNKMRQIEQEHREQDYEALLEQEPVVPEEQATVQDVAVEWNVDEDTAASYIEQHGSGVVSAGTYLPPEAVEEIRERLAELDDMSLDRVQSVLDEYGAGNDILDDLGYTIQWTSLDQSSAVVKRKETEE